MKWMERFRYCWWYCSCCLNWRDGKDRKVEQTRLGNEDEYRLLQVHWTKSSLLEEWVCGWEARRDESSRKISDRYLQFGSQGQHFNHPLHSNISNIVVLEMYSSRMKKYRFFRFSLSFSPPTLFFSLLTSIHRVSLSLPILFRKVIPFNGFFPSFFLCLVTFPSPVILCSNGSGFPRSRFRSSFRSATGKEKR